MCRVAWYNLKTSQCYFKPRSEAFIPLISLSFPQIKCVFFFFLATKNVASELNAPSDSGFSPFAGTAEGTISHQTH